MTTTFIDLTGEVTVVTTNPRPTKRLRPPPLHAIYDIAEVMERILFIKEKAELKLWKRSMKIVLPELRKLAEPIRLLFDTPHISPASMHCSSWGEGTVIGNVSNVNGEMSLLKATASRMTCEKRAKKVLIQTEPWTVLEGWFFHIDHHSTQTTDFVLDLWLRVEFDRFDQECLRPLGWRKLAIKELAAENSLHFRSLRAKARYFRLKYDIALPWEPKVAEVLENKESDLEIFRRFCLINLPNLFATPPQRPPLLLPAKPRKIEFEELIRQNENFVERKGWKAITTPPKVTDEERTLFYATYGPNGPHVEGCD